MAEGTERALEHGQSGHGRIGRSDEDPAASSGAEDQEFFYEVAPGAAEDSVAGDDGTPHYAADGDVSEDRERCVLTVVGWQAAVADRDSEVSEAAGASTSASTSSSASEAGQRS